MLTRRVRASAIPISIDFADLDGYRMTVNGSLVAHNNVGLKDAKSVLSIYNPELLDQLMKYQATSNAVPLEVTSWTEQ